MTQAPATSNIVASEHNPPLPPTAESQVEPVSKDKTDNKDHILNKAGHKNP